MPTALSAYGEQAVRRYGVPVSRMLTKHLMLCGKIFMYPSNKDAERPLLRHYAERRDEKGEILAWKPY